MLLLIFLSYSLLAVFLLGSLISISIQTQSPLLFGSLIVISFLFFSQVWKEWSESKKNQEQGSLKLVSFDFKSLIFLLTGTFASFYINHGLGLGAVIGSSIVGLIGALFFKQYATNLYCGSFIGMACSVIFANPFSLVAAASVAGLLFVLSQNVIGGYGGKLGFLAFGGTYVASTLFQTPFRVITPLSNELYPLVFIYVIGAGLATFALQKECKLDAVTASALVGLILALVHPDPTHTVVVAAFCASFTGMVSPEKFNRYSDMIVLTFITSILFVAAFSLFDGSGGKLGSIAFLSTVSGLGLKRYVMQINDYISNRKNGSPSSKHI